MVLVEGDLSTLQDTHAMLSEFSLEEGVTFLLAIGFAWDDVRACISITDSQDPNNIIVGLVLSTFPYSH